MSSCQPLWPSGRMHVPAGLVGPGSALGARAAHSQHRCGAGNILSTDGSKFDLSKLSTSAAHVKAGMGFRAEYTDEGAPQVLLLGLVLDQIVLLSWLGSGACSPSG